MPGIPLFGSLLYRFIGAKDGTASMLGTAENNLFGGGARLPGRAHPFPPVRTGRELGQRDSATLTTAPIETE